MGFNYTAFWHGEPAEVDYFIEATKIKTKNNAMNDDILAWNTGKYVMYALCASIYPMIDKHANMKYPQEPELVLKLDEELAQKKRDAEILKMEQDFLAVSRALAARDNLIDEPAN